MIKLKLPIKLTKDESTRWKSKMESLNLIHGLAFITTICFIIVTTSITMYLKSDRSKYDLYRPGRSQPEQKTVENQVNVDRSEDLPVYQEEINDVIGETNQVIEANANKSAFSPEDLSDGNIVPPDLNLSQ